MWQVEQISSVNEEIAVVVSSLPVEIRALIKEPLRMKRRALAVQSEQDTPWMLLPLIICESISSDFRKAIPLAATIQFLMAAGDVFDDIEDDDSPQSLCAKYGSAVATNVGTTLPVLGEKAIARLRERDINEKTIVHIFDAINSYYINACIGQHMDLSFNKKKDVSEDTYLKIATLKSASQIECACYTGALLAT
ncbi:MAG: polyprenyl synthetase family protein, partial [Dehalococcoidales bacterium]|nr:polyprenyl synthetase family protein [Dehalococcoidales bacterium]